MTTHVRSDGSDATSRRDFLKVSTTVVGGLVTTLPFAPNVHAGGSDVLRLGLIGCGGRGTGAAAEALNADKHVNLVAMGDVFADRLQLSLDTLRKDTRIADKIEV